MGRYPEIGQAIRAARLKKKWSQEHAAAQVGISRMQWIRWEQGLHKPKGDSATRLTAALGLASSLLEDDEEVRRSLETDLNQAIARAVNHAVERAVAQRMERVA